jgi:hypothetical protein
VEDTFIESARIAYQAGTSLAIQASEELPELGPVPWSASFMIISCSVAMLATPWAFWSKRAPPWATSKSTVSSTPIMPRNNNVSSSSILTKKTSWSVSGPTILPATLREGSSQPEPSET